MTDAKILQFRQRPPKPPPDLDDEDGEIDPRREPWRIVTDD